MTIKDLQPALVWNNFYGLTQCPRPSKHEEIVRAHILDWAKQRGIEAFADETGNIVMSRPKPIHPRAAGFITVAKKPLPASRPRQAKYMDRPKERSMRLALVVV